MGDRGHTAFVLGFVHEEEIQILGFCAGTDHCLSLMLAYAASVLVALVGVTLLLVGLYYRFEERLRQYAAYFPRIAAGVLALMGVGFIFGSL